MNNFQILYTKIIKQNLLKKFGYKSSYQVPKIEKIVISTALGLRAEKSSILNKEIEDLRTISGQHPIHTKAKKSISEFGIKKGSIVGLLVTLRREKMYAFLEKLIKLYLPRIRDFKGLSFKHFDKNANFNLGISDKTIFPELDYINLTKSGYTVTIVTRSNSLHENYFLLKEFGFPFNNSP